MLPVKSPECNNATIAPCRDRTIFRPEDSASWNYTGIFSTPEQWSLPSSAVTSNEVNLTWGTDRVDFGNIVIQNLGFAEQFVLEITSLDFVVGIFGLSLNQVVPYNAAYPATLLSAAAASEAIPSLSFSYTAGSAQSMY
jgi:hypothetical protein